ncbi:MAG: sulfite exporter TauE/SafE family protein [Clostridiales bacterium]|nr:sulfite exporter TauE/SafE family protein [Clostridiales bacterium]
MSKLYSYISGAVIGLINGIFGSGGGIIAVPMLKKNGLEVKKSHATSLAITMPLSIVSCFFYAKNGNLNFSFAIKLIPLGLIGAAIGGFIIKKIPDKILKRVFGLMLIIAGVRLFTK